MFQTLVEIQRTIYTALAEQIKILSTEGDWLAFLAFLPMGILFGAVHALTPGHSKAVLATYLAGSEAKIARGLLVADALVHACDDRRADRRFLIAACLDCAW